MPDRPRALCRPFVLHHRTAPPPSYDCLASRHARRRPRLGVPCYRPPDARVRMHTTRATVTARCAALAYTPMMCVQQPRPPAPAMPSRTLDGLRRMQSAQSEAAWRSNLYYTAVTADRAAPFQLQPRLSTHAHAASKVGLADAATRLYRCTLVLAHTFTCAGAHWVAVADRGAAPAGSCRLCRSSIGLHAQDPNHCKMHHCVRTFTEWRDKS